MPAAPATAGAQPAPTSRERAEVFGAFLAFLRRRMRLTQRGLAALLDYSPGYVAGIESGEPCSGRYLAALVSFYIQREDNHLSDLAAVGLRAVLCRWWLYASEPELYALHYGNEPPWRWEWAKTELLAGQRKRRSA